MHGSEHGGLRDCKHLASKVGTGRLVIDLPGSEPQSDLPHVPLLILITSTHGRGHPPPAMIPLWTALLRSGLPDHILEGEPILDHIENAC